MARDLGYCGSLPVENESPWDWRKNGTSQSVLFPGARGETFIRLLAVGGEGVDGMTLKTTEWWNHDDDEWEEGPVLDNPRSSLAAALVPVDLVCGSLVNGTFCQTEQNNVCLPTSECTLQGEDFVCQTEGSEEGEKCDKQKCPLHLDPPEEKAPKQESQSTGCTILLVVQI